LAGGRRLLDVAEMRLDGASLPPYYPRVAIYTGRGTREPLGTEDWRQRVGPHLLALELRGFDATLLRPFAQHVLPTLGRLEELTVQVFNGELPVILGLLCLPPSVRSLRMLSDWWYTGVIGEPVAPRMLPQPLSHLTALEFNNGFLGPWLIEQLAHCPRLTHLSVGISGNYPLDRDTLPPMPRLQSLALWVLPVNDVTLQCIPLVLSGVLALSPFMSRLAVHYNIPVSPGDVELLWGVVAESTVTELELKALILGAQPITGIGRLKQLRTLRVVEYAPVEGMHELANLKDLRLLYHAPHEVERVLAHRLEGHGDAFWGLQYLEVQVSNGKRDEDVHDEYVKRLRGCVGPNTVMCFMCD
jgi:hypothetical protein